MQKSEETFKEYTQQWRGLAAIVQPPLLERELGDMSMGNLQAPYLYRMIGSTSSGFSNSVLAGKRIENMIKLGKIQNFANTSGVVKKPFVAYGKKREGETNATTVVRARALMYCLPDQQVVVITPFQQK